eukprot:gnl/TRDRNA2_/TRDRNA2_156976_c1_seq2.p1 gnl/TRDRNA2_/TRDRNA2_156976_c1~~gnl/TRDRNA2_/TRDRNA2_156976_c1_seq2.p1  ORF type:complete len:452 (+),score=88.51 gnl/TRDRNA2_/TRDRNA2_156976_c1_seq2:2-1357(+)
MCDLFTWLGDRGLCTSCVDAVTAALLEVRRAVTSAAACAASGCTCQHCIARTAEAKATAAALAVPCSDSLDKADDALLAASGLSRRLDFIRVSGRLRTVCGVYRREPLPFNGRPVFKKERSESYLLYTSLKDWMISGRPDAGGSRCEGWAYVNDSAESPDEVVGTWRVSGPRGWEEDRSLCVTAFEMTSAGVDYDDGSAIAKCLTADERGVLLVKLKDPDVLSEVFWTPEEPAPGKASSGGCAHVTTVEAVQRELRCWLRWFLRDRLDLQHWRLLAQAQVGASLCRLFACAALQQLEQAAESPAPGAKSREKKARAKKGKAALRDNDDCLAEADGTDAPYASGGGSSSLASSPAGNASRSAALANDSDESASTRASSEEPPVKHQALATNTKRLMKEMGWSRASEAALNLEEVAAWRDSNPRYRQEVRAEREKLRIQFQQWAQAALPASEH